MPDDLGKLLSRQSLVIADDDWYHGCDRLIEVLETRLGRARGSALGRFLRYGTVTAIVGAAAAVLAFLSPIAGLLFYLLQLARSYFAAAEKMGQVADKIGQSGSAPTSISGWWGFAIFVVVLTGGGFWWRRYKRR